MCAYTTQPNQTPANRLFSLRARPTTWTYGSRGFHRVPKTKHSATKMTSTTSTTAGPTKKHVPTQLRTFSSTSLIAAAPFFPPALHLPTRWIDYRILDL